MLKDFCFPVNTFSKYYYRPYFMASAYLTFALLGYPDASFKSIVKPNAVNDGAKQVLLCF